MKIMISYQVDTVEEAKEVMAAVENRGKLTTFRVQDAPDAVYGAAELLAASGVKPEAQAAPDVVKVPRPNVSPGVPLITKIGSNTKEYILNELKASGAPRTLEHFGLKYAEHLKLLWSRGEIKFDGSEYYL